MRILIVKTGSLGDLFHALPAVHLLKTGLNAEIDWVVSSNYVPLVKCFTDVERVIPFPSNSLRSFLSDLRKDQYDLVVDMQGLLKSALIARAARSHKRIGPSFHREFAYLFYDHVAAERNKERHAVDENLDVLRFLELPVEPVQFPVRFPVPSFTGQTSPLKILLAPCARHAARNWPVERFAAVGKVLHETTGAMLYISGVPEDADTCKKLMELLPPGSAHNLCGKTSLEELGGVFQAMALVITVESGPMHMSAATGTPTLAIFGPTDPLRAGPYGAQHRVLRKTDIISNSKDNLKSILGVSVDAVVSAAGEMLRQQRETRQ